MKKLVIAASVSVLLAACAGGMGMSGNGSGASNPMVGGAPMYPTKDIVDNAVNSKEHTTLVAAVKAGDLVGTLKSPGPVPAESSRTGPGGAWKLSTPICHRPS